MLGRTVIQGSHNATLPEGVTPMQSSRWQRVAELSEAVFEAELAKLEPSTAALVKAANKLRQRGASAQVRPRRSGQSAIAWPSRIAATRCRW